MAEGIKYCRNCGKQINRDAKFCRYCGYQFQMQQENKPAANICPKCGNENAAGAKFCRYCGNPLSTAGRPQRQAAPASSASPAARQKKDAVLNRPAGEPLRKQPAKKTAKRALCLVLALAVTAFALFKYPGFLVKKPGESRPAQTAQSAAANEAAAPASAATAVQADSLTGNDPNSIIVEEDNYRVTSDWKTEEVVSGTLTEDRPSISKDGVSLTVREGLLEEDSAVRIQKSAETVDYVADGVTVPMTMYDFSVDGIKSDTLVDLEIPFEKPEGGEVGAGYYDPETGTILPVHYDYDEYRGVITIHTTHLSTFCGFPVKDENTRNCMLPYLSSGDLISMFYAQDDRSLKQHTEIFEKSATAGDSIEIAAEMADSLGTGSLILGTVQSAADVVGGIEGALSAANGGGSTIMLNSQSTIGEMLNTWRGLGGGYGGQVNNNAKLVSIDDKLKSTYPGELVSNIGKGLNVMNTLCSCVKIFNHAMKGDSTAAAWESSQLAFDRVMAVIGEHGTPALGVYMTGVSLFAYALNEFYTEARQGRKEVYMKAYNKYYEKGGNGYRSSPQWMKVIKEILRNGGGADEVQAEIDRYCREFWVIADDFGIDYLENVMTEDEKIAWGAAGQAGLNDSVKKEISDTKKAELVPVIQNVMRILTMKNEEEALERYMKQYETTRRLLNQIITLEIIDGSKEEGQNSSYEGCIVRFKELKEKVTDAQNWETALKADGKCYIQFRLLAHMMVNAGTTLEVVRKNGDEEEIVLEQEFKLDVPRTKIVLDLPKAEEENSEFKTFSVRFVPDWTYMGYKEGSPGARDEYFIQYVWGQLGNGTVTLKDGVYHIDVSTAGQSYENFTVQELYLKGDAEDRGAEHPISAGYTVVQSWERPDQGIRYEYTFTFKSVNRCTFVYDYEHDGGIWMCSGDYQAAYRDYSMKDGHLVREEISDVMNNSMTVCAYFE